MATPKKTSIRKALDAIDVLAENLEDLSQEMFGRNFRILGSNIRDLAHRVSGTKNMLTRCQSTFERLLANEHMLIIDSTGEVRAMREEDYINLMKNHKPDRNEALI